MSAQEPIRFLDDPNAPEGLRSLIDSARQAEPSRGAAERIAAGVQAHIGSPSGGEAASGSTSSGAGSSGAASGGAGGGAAGTTVGAATAARVGGLLLAATTLIGGGIWWASQPSQSSAPAQAPSSNAVARVGTERGSSGRGSTETPEAEETSPGTAGSSDAATTGGAATDAGDAKEPTPEARAQVEADAPQGAPAQRQAQAEAPREPSARDRTREPREARPGARGTARDRHQAQPERSAAPAAKPARPSPEPSEHTESDSNGASEGQLLRRAQDALPAQPRQALQLTAEHARRFPDGHLVQEREVLAVEALVELGRVERARSRAQRFLDEHANTAHRTRLEALFENEGGIHPGR